MACTLPRPIQFIERANLNCCLSVVLRKSLKLTAQYPCFNLAIHSSGIVSSGYFDIGSAYCPVLGTGPLVPPELVAGAIVPHG
jgi:hypothetical protein